MGLYLFTLATMVYLRLIGAKRLHFRAGRVRLAYYRLGPATGEPWVLLHGLGSVAATWDAVMRALRGECRLIVPELSALGGSQIPGHGLGVARGSEVVGKLIRKEFGERPVTVAGISLGGWTAVRLALAHPEQVARLVLVDAGGYRDQDWDEIHRMVTVSDLTDVDRLYQALFVHTPWIMRLSRAGFLRAYTSPAVTNVLGELAEKDTFGDEELGQLRMPTAVIWGENDGLFKAEVAHAMAAALPQAHLEMMPGCGHALHMEQPQRMVEAIQRFRKATSAQAGAVRTAAA